MIVGHFSESHRRIRGSVCNCLYALLSYVSIRLLHPGHTPITFSLRIDILYVLNNKKFRVYNRPFHPSFIEVVKVRTHDAKVRSPNLSAPDRTTNSHNRASRLPCGHPTPSYESILSQPHHTTDSRAAQATVCSSAFRIRTST